MTTFLKTVTDDLIRRYGLHGLGQVTMVFPMQRASLFVRRHIQDCLQQSGETSPVLMPHFTTINSLFDTLSLPGSEDEVVSVCRLYSAYCHHTSESLPIDIFYGWGNQLMTDFSNADMALLNVEKVMRHSSEAAELDALCIDDEVRSRLQNLLGEKGEAHSVRRYFTSLWQVLPDIYRSFTDSQQADGVGTRGARSRWVVEHFDDEHVQTRISNRTFVFVGFNYLLAAERELMRLLHERSQALFYFDYDPDFRMDDSVYRFIREDMTLFANALPTFNVQRSTFHSPITAIACQSSSAQASYVHDWLLANHHPGDKTAIVLADETMLQSVIYALPRRSEDERFGRVNVTKGYPLRHTRMYAEAVRLLEEQHASGESLAPSALLTSLARGLEQYYRSARRRQDDDWQQVLTDEAYYQCQLVLREMQTLLTAHPEIMVELGGSSLLASLIRRRLEAVSIPFHGEPITDIQIIGVLETRLLDFDNVLILNVEEGVVPNTAADRSFIPFDLRKAYGMQTREEESKIYAYNFFRLLRRASHVTMTFSEATTEMGQQTMSRFLMQMLTSPDFRVDRLRLVPCTMPLATCPLPLVTCPLPLVPCPLPLATCTNPLAPNEVYGERVPEGRERGFSPSSICDYVFCPRQFYYRHIERIYEPQDESVMFTPSTFGSLVHGTLEQYYHSGKTLTLSEALDKAYEKQFPPLAPGERGRGKEVTRSQHEAENHVILQMAENVCQLDIRQQSVILESEKKFARMFQVDEQRSVKIEGKVDRLDKVNELGRDVLRVVDFKTGRYDKSKLTFNEDLAGLFTDPKHRYALQTMLYCMMVRGTEGSPCPNLPIVPELFYPSQIDTDSHLFMGKEPLLDYDRIVPEFEEGLRELLKRILSDTEYPMAEQSDCESSFCPYHLLCGRTKKKFNF